QDCGSPTNRNALPACGTVTPVCALGFLLGHANPLVPLQQRVIPTGAARPFLSRRFPARRAAQRRDLSPLFPSLHLRYNASHSLLPALGSFSCAPSSSPPLSESKDHTTPSPFPETSPGTPTLL